MSADEHPVPTVPSPGIIEPDAHGQAALLLVESLLHMLVDAEAITRRQAVTAVEVAAAVKVEVAEIAEESPARMKESLALLSAIGRSLGMDEGLNPQCLA